MNDGKNYQPVMIKKLNQSDGKATKRQIQKELNKENPGFPASHFDKFPFDVLENHGVVELKDGYYELIAFKTYEKESGKVGEITYQCNERIGGDVRNELKQLLEKGVSERVYKALLWYWKKKGSKYTRDQLAKPKRDGFIDEDELLENDQRLHGMVKGTYKAQGEQFAQAIMLNPDSKWDMELKPNHPTIRIDYDYKDTNPDQVSWMEKSFVNDVPLGVIFCVGKNKWKVLGLCKVKEKITDTSYRLESWGITDEESTMLKEEAIRDYDHYHTSSDMKKFEPIRWDEINSKLKTPIKSEKVTTKPNNKKIEEILYEIQEGNWVLPDFQRTYAWNSGQVTDLLNSIFFGRYIGSLLLWNVEDEDEEEMGTEAIEGSGKKNDRYKEIILDGQQRITSIHYAVKAPDKTPETRNHPGYFYINCKGFLQDDDEDVIINTSKKLEEKDTFDRLLFPLYCLEDKESWLNGLREFLQEQDKWDEKFERQIIGEIRVKVDSMESFVIPAITLERIPYDRVSVTFEKINTTGATLKVFDLMNNRMAGYGIKLNKMWTDVEDKFPSIKRYNEEMQTKISRYILESISLSHTPLKSTKKADILNMFKKMKQKENWTKEKFEKLWDDTIKHVVYAIDFLEDKQKGLGVPSPDFLPYEPIFPVLTSLIQQTKENFNDDELKCEQKIREWYWASVFGERYSQGVEGKKSADYREMLEWFRDESSIPRFIINFRENYIRIPFDEITRSKSAVYRGVMCLIMKKGAEDPMIRFEADREQHMDHIFPKSKLEKSIKNSVLNMTWLTGITNIKKSNKMPNEYYTKIKKDKFDNNDEKFLKALSSHLIGKESVKYLLEEEFEEFLESRKTDILKEIANEIGLVYRNNEVNVPTQINKDTPFSNMAALMWKYEECNKEFMLVSLFCASGDLKRIMLSGPQLKVKKIRLLTSVEVFNKTLKEDFMKFNEEMEEKGNIKSEMRVMSEEVKGEQHARYLADPEKCWKSLDYTIAKSGKSDSIDICKTVSLEDLEKWWDDSYDVVKDVTKIQPLLEEHRKKVERRKQNGNQ